MTPENHLYEYSVIRLVPSVEREEFLNVGVIMFCKKQKFIKMLYELSEQKLLALSADFDTEQARLNLQAFKEISEGNKKCGPMALMDVPERFRWLTAVRSSSIQTSRPHPGLTTNLEQTMIRLFNELVL